MSTCEIKRYTYIHTYTYAHTHTPPTHTHIHTHTDAPFQTLTLHRNTATVSPFCPPRPSRQLSSSSPHLLDQWWCPQTDPTRRNSMEKQLWCNLRRCSNGRCFLSNVATGDHQNTACNSVTMQLLPQACETTVTLPFHLIHSYKL